jgi:hypothetical protein
MTESRLSRFTDNNGIVNAETAFYENRLPARKAQGYPPPPPPHPHDPFFNCTTAEFAVWTTSGGERDARCYKDYHLYPFAAKEPANKPHTKSIFPPGNCAESIVTEQIL